MDPTNPPTLLIDEADTIFGPKAGDNEDLRGLLNAGHQRGRPTLRYDAGTKTVDKIETFAMAALAGIGNMPDTIEDRAAVIRMRRRAPGETVQPYRVRRDGPALGDLRTDLHTWITAHLDELTNAEPAMPLEDRAADTWEPLIALADLAGGDWPTAARIAALTLLADRESSADIPLPARLLTDCRTAFGYTPALSSVGLVDRLRADDEAPWSDLPAPAGLTVRKLAAMLRDFEITSGNVRFPDGSQAKGYTRDAFEDTWNRYCPTPENTDQEGTVPIRPNRPFAGHTGDGSIPWDGSTVPTSQTVPALTCEGTVGTDWDGSPQTTKNPICIGCRQPLTHDDGTHTHPTCETA